MIRQPLPHLPLTFAEQVLHTRGGGAVQRAHTIRYQGSYSVAEHSWGVAMLIWHLFPEKFRDIAIFALVHDVAECLVGDVPSTAKDNCTQHDLEDCINGEFGLPRMDQMGAYEHWILKLCDRLDLYIWAKEQRAAGNLFADEIINNLETLFQRDDAFVYNGWLTNDGQESAKKLYETLERSNCVPDRRNLLGLIKEYHEIPSSR